MITERAPVRPNNSNKTSHKEMIKWIFAASEIDTCCEATGGAQCCREANWARWCAKPPQATANDRNPREEEKTIELQYD